MGTRGGVIIWMLIPSCSCVLGLCTLVPFVCSGVMGSGDGDGQLFWVVMVVRGVLWVKGGGGFHGGVWLVWGDGCVHCDTSVIDTENWVCLVVGL